MTFLFGEGHRFRLKHFVKLGGGQEAKADASLSTLKEKLEAIDTKGLNENLMQTAESMNKLTQRVDAMVYKNEDQVGNAVEELNTILENLEEFTQKIKNNPSALIRTEGKSGR